MIKACITNLGYYLEGTLIGKWISFPMTKEEFDKTLKDIKIGTEKDGRKYEEYFISDYDFEVPEMAECFHPYSSVYAINVLAKRLASMTKEEVEKFTLIVKSGLELPTGGIHSLINLTYNLDSYTVIEDAGDDNSFGHYVFETCYEGLELDDLIYYIDYDALGRDTRINELGEYCDGYYIRQERDDTMTDCAWKLVNQEREAFGFRRDKI